ncbi:hypothetical protein AWB70_07583 [Caballeronia cordobensis]|uniref:Uncharacterized protein n=1 Tax=Caballeronia cordobensis TaxID=1353886 RepID=A0A158JVL3_CABCO|nr:hypothetical protein AWB70_07583 [Caballeronia cordobensis]
MPCAGDDYRFAHRRMRDELRFDLAEFDTEAANLDLMIVAAEELDIAIGAIAGEVAGAVHARACYEGAGDEPLRSKRSAPQIPFCKARTADIKFTRHANRQGAQVFIEHVGLRVGERLSDGNRHAVGDGFVQRMSQHAHGRFGRAVVIEDAHAGLECLQRQNPVGSRCFAAKHEQLRRQCGRRFERDVHERAQMTRHDLQNADIALTHVLPEQVAIGRALVRQHMQFMTCRQCTEQDRIAEIGGNGRSERHFALRRHVHFCEHAAQIVAKVPVTENDTLGLAGRAGGIDHISRAPRMRFDRRCSGGAGVDQHRVGIDADDGNVLRNI